MAKSPSKGAAPATPARKVASSKGKMRSERSGAAARPVPTTGKIKVRATQTGWYGLSRRREGDVFVINKASEFSERWMEVVEGTVPLKHTGPQAAINKAHDEILGGTATRPKAEDDDDVE
jgi:hypothetical protein